jgi:4-amino-4-deoxy-L-arabinose transferase-like glycosyltransferase
MNSFLDEARKILAGKRSSLYILAFLIILGAFLRTYHFHDWLYFYPDQARDVTIVEEYLSGKEPLPLLGFKAASTDFKLGAMYSYFQIISAKIFGSNPGNVAYPDMFFGVMSIPLLYYFFNRYFATNVSLAVTGLYAVSFYVIRYARFAWNSNPIPFFAILFLMSLHEFIHEKEKTHWTWILWLGISVGVGVQLHTVLLILLPMMLICALIYLRKFNVGIWKQWVMILLVALFLNTGQIISETKSGLGNVQDFFSVLNDRSTNSGGGIVENLALNVICDAQANILFTSSLENDDDCHTFSYLNYLNYEDKEIGGYVSSIVNILLGLMILCSGYWLLWKYFHKEKDEKKKLFLGLNLVYGALMFLVMLPIIGHNGVVRYWLPAVFLPFLFLALGWQYLIEKKAKYYWIGISLFVVLIFLNFFTIISQAIQFEAKTRSNAQYVVLGELEDINGYIMGESSPQKEANIFGGQKYMQNFYRPLFYVAAKHDFTMIRGGRHPEDIPKGSPIFFIAQNPASEVSNYDAYPEEAGFKILSSKMFGNIAVYKVIMN